MNTKIKVQGEPTYKVKITSKPTKQTRTLSSGTTVLSQAAMFNLIRKI